MRFLDEVLWVEVGKTGKAQQGLKPYLFKGITLDSQVEKEEETRQGLKLGLSRVMKIGPLLERQKKPDGD